MKTFCIGVFLLCASGKLFSQVGLNCDGFQQILTALHNGSIKGGEKYGSSSSEKYKILESKLTVSGQSDAFIFVSQFSDFPTVSAHYTIFSGSKKDALAKWEELSTLLRSCNWPGWAEDTKQKKKNFYPIATGNSMKPGYIIVAVSYTKEKSKPGNPWEVSLFFEETFESLSGY
jgi:hypothetical protein